MDLVPVAAATLFEELEERVALTEVAICVDKVDTFPLPEYVLVRLPLLVELDMHFTGIFSFLG